MSWAPNDLVSDSDLLAYEDGILSRFKRVEWRDRRQKAIEDWLQPLLASKSLPLHRLRTRYVPDAVYGYTAAAYSDRTSAASEQTVDDVPLATIFATPASDYLYVGSERPFRGLSIRMADTVSATASVLSVSAWSDTWKAVSELRDGTQATNQQTFSGGGAVTWRLPTDWVTRTVNGSAHLYWVRLSISSTLTASTAAGQIGCIRRSLLCAAVTFRTLELIFREAISQDSGPWSTKADFYAQEAERAWQRVQDLVGGEFDTETEDDVIDDDEAEQTIEEAGGTTFSWERG